MKNDTVVASSSVVILTPFRNAGEVLQESISNGGDIEEEKWLNICYKFNLKVLLRILLLKIEKSKVAQFLA